MSGSPAHSAALQRCNQPPSPASCHQIERLPRETDGKTRTAASERARGKRLAPSVPLIACASTIRPTRRRVISSLARAAATKGSTRDSKSCGCEGSGVWEHGG